MLTAWLFAVAAASAPPAGPELAEDVAVLARALEEVYAGRKFTAEAAWSSMKQELAAFGARPYRDSAAFCSALTSFLVQLGHGSVYAALDDRGTRCPSADGLRRPGSVIAAEETGSNVAGDTLYVLRTESPSIAILGVRRFAPASSPEWKGFDRAIASAAGAAALILDLRGARGSDPTVVLPLIERLAGEGKLAPLRGVERRSTPLADEARRAYAKIFGEQTTRDPAVWAALIGAEPKAYPKNRDRSRDKPIFVLLGEGCEEACELTARMLETYAAAFVLGATGTEERSVPYAEPGVVVLPRSRVRVFMPTAIYFVNDYLGTVTGDRGYWYQRGWAYRYVRRETAFDALPGAISSAREQLAYQQRLARWRDRALPPCASYKPILRQDQLPAHLREKMNGWYDSKKVRDGDQFVTVYLDVPAERAIAFLAGCPDFEHEPHGSGDGHGASSIYIHPRNFAAISRVLQSEAVSYVKAEEDREPQLY